jgi:hypothetical protein
MGSNIALLDRARVTLDVLVSHSEFVKFGARNPNPRYLLGNTISDGYILRLGMMLRHSEIQSMTEFIPTYNDGDVR